MHLEETILGPLLFLLEHKDSDLFLKQFYLAVNKDKNMAIQLRESA